MIVDSGINRFESGWKHPDLVSGGSIALTNDVGAPSTDYQNAGYKSAEGGLGTVFSDITSGNFGNIPSSIVSGLGSGDIGSYVIVGAFGLLLVPMLLKGGSKSKARATSRRASLKGAIARETELLKAV